MSQIEVDKVIPQSGTALQVGEASDTINVPSGATLNINSGATITNNGTASGFDTDTNDKVKVSTNDTTPGFLNGKLVAGTNISLTEGSDGGNETLTAAFSGNLNASVINAGTIATARLGSGTASSTTFLRGDQTYAAAGGGKVLQVVSGITTTEVTTTSTSYVDSGLSATITPSATSSKILVLVSMDIIVYRQSAGYFRAQVNLLRDSTQLFYNHFGGYSDVGTDNAEYGANNRTYLDSPSSTSAITYKTQVQVASGATSKLQEGGASSRPSTITLIEVGA